MDFILAAVENYQLSVGCNPMEIKRSNPKAFQQLDLRFKELQSKQVNVGWFADRIYPKTGIPVASIAAQNELGFEPKRIPPRPFMRPAFIDTQDKVREIANRGAIEILAGKSDATKVMNTIGLVVQAEVYKNITEVTTPILRPYTIAMRRSRGNTSIKPLNDTGEMLGTLTSQVENADTI